MKQISRTLIRFITLLALVSLACGGTGTTVNVPQVTIPQGEFPRRR